MATEKLATNGKPQNKRAPTPTDQAVGVQIRVLRRAAGMTLRDIGDAVGVSFVQFQRYETGVSRVSASRLFAIGDVLGVGVESLVAKTNAPGQPPDQRGVESAELVRAFNAIADPRHRLAIIGLAQAMVTQGEHADACFTLDPYPTTANGNGSGDPTPPVDKK